MVINNFFCYLKLNAPMKSGGGDFFFLSYRKNKHRFAIEKCYILCESVFTYFSKNKEVRNSSRMEA